MAGKGTAKVRVEDQKLGLGIEKILKPPAYS
jgi:hypothetical protein